MPFLIQHFPPASRHILHAASKKSVRCLTTACRASESTAQRLLSDTAGGYAALQKADAAWRRLCSAPLFPEEAPVEVVQEVARPASTPLGADASSDVVILGGTLGIFLATALLLRGKRVAVVERGALQGREQEWNISRAEMAAFVEAGVLTAAEVEEALVSEFNPVRVSIEGRVELRARDVLNCGVSPAALLRFVKQRFLAQGGKLLEGVAFHHATVHPEGVRVELQRVGSPGGSPGGPPSGARGAGGSGAELETSYAQGDEGRVVLGCQLLVDAMGSFSPIARQARRGRKPDSVVLLVGSCATGLPRCEVADLLHSFTGLDKQRGVQYFWEAFPARDGLTTYMFAYLEPHPGAVTLEQMFADYLELLPRYRGVPSLQGVTFRRAFHGFVPNWDEAPLVPPTGRLLAIGDAAGNRSALSFAGFGSLARHLARLTEGVAAALEGGHLTRGALQGLQPASPAISLTSAMQYTMGTRTSSDIAGAREDVIVASLANNFAEMERLGPAAYKAFMQDYIQAGTLGPVVLGPLQRSPRSLLDITLFMRSPRAGALFAGSLLGLLWYDALFRLACAVQPAHQLLLKPTPALLFRWNNLVEAFRFGSGNDYPPEEEEQASLQGSSQ